MRNTARRPKIIVSDDGPGIVSQARALLLTETALVIWLVPGLSTRLGRWRQLAAQGCAVITPSTAVRTA